MKACVAIAAALFASSAAAGPMMGQGVSPEAGFAGVWRVVGAEAAPWAKPRKLTKADAPLLEYAIDFETGEVKGPPALACKAAKFQSGVSYPDEIFGGGRATAAKTLAFGNSEITTYRVVCDGRARDYYVDDQANLKMADGDVVYTLARPTGMDTERYTAGFSGPSFDCTKAKTAGERLICSDADLSASDRKLAAAYRALKASLSAESFATFQAGQRGWIAYTLKSCSADPANVVSECLKSAYDSRIELLESAKVVRFGALTIEPRLRFRTRMTPATEESDITPYMQGGPEANAFNAFIAKALKLDRWRMDDKTLFRYGDDVGAPLHAHRVYSVDHFDARTVKLTISTSDFVGGRDEETGAMTLTWDLRAGRALSP